MKKPTIFKLMIDFAKHDTMAILENIRKTLNGNAEALNEMYKILEKQQKDIDDLKKGGTR